ncbi:nucleoside hydrolase [Pantanalinema sp. GBBB05]|uniref:nucleoside hydrolase n=1 Tax=Pantanalinema sp. GBBB05 TaxID=2604139 RepID=UPI001D1E325C|nr:nucleoside hydrolase [Pantanalinema sp. GBBB05]
MTIASKPKIILDTDPGGDDCFALLWLLSLVKQGVAELVAITSVDGNVHARLTFIAAGKLLKLCGYNDVEVGRGVIGGSAGKIADAGEIHGADGMGNLSHTLPDDPQRAYEMARGSEEILIEQLQAKPGEITIVAIAPLTNLAAAERRSPGVLKLAKEIVIMGGAFQAPGNVSSEAEFNIAYDSRAAQQVFSSCDNLIVMPLDITRQLIFTPELAAQVSAVNPTSAIARFIVDLCQFMVGTALKFREVVGESGFLVHDAVTLAYLFYPETLLFRRAQVEIETQGEWTTGKTVIDRRRQPKTGSNAWVAMEVDQQVVLTALVEDLKFLII